MLRTLTISAAATTLLAIAVPAAAQEGPASTGDWSFSFGAATDNRSKDASKSDGEPFGWVQGGWENASGFFYATAGLETIKSSTGSELEGEANIGIRPELAGFDLDLSATRKYQFDANPGADNDAWEFTADVKRSIGPVSGRLRLQHSPDGTGGTEAWTWVAARAGMDFSNKLTGTVEIGRREQDNSVDYTGWNAGVTYALTNHVEAELRYHATDADVPGEQYADALVAGISFSF